MKVHTVGFYLYHNLVTKVDKQFPEARNGGKELTKRA